MTPTALRPIRCQSCGKLICEADGTVIFRCPRCKRKHQSGAPEPIAYPALSLAEGEVRV